MDQFFEMPPVYESLRDRFLSEFPKNKIEGINTGRVEEFLRGEGLEVKPYIVFEIKDLPKIKEILGNSFSLERYHSGSILGNFAPELNMVFLLRSRDLEEVNGTVVTEGFLVHELAHANNTHCQKFVTKGETTYVPRYGFCLYDGTKTPWGCFLEEGWADILRTKYVSRYLSTEGKNKLFDCLGFGPIHYIGWIEDTVPFYSPDGKGEILPLTAKYFYVSPDGNQATILSAFAGFALELLCQTNPSLKNYLLEGRNSVEGLRKVARAIEQIKPGLYKKLQIGDASDQDFWEKLSFVIKNVAGGMKEAVSAKEGDKMGYRWENILGELKLPKPKKERKPWKIF